MSSEPAPFDSNHSSAVNFAQTVDSVIETELTHEATAGRMSAICMLVFSIRAEETETDCLCPRYNLSSGVLNLRCLSLDNQTLDIPINGLEL